jgi:hypothetical protein
MNKTKTFKKNKNMKKNANKINHKINHKMKTIKIKKGRLYGRKTRRGGSHRLCSKHKIYVKGRSGKVDKASSVRGIINKFKCYHAILNNESYDESTRDVALKQMDSLIEYLIRLEREKKGILLNHLISNDYYKSLTDDDLISISGLITRMQEEAIPLSMPILDYLMRERGLI